MSNCMGKRKVKKMATGAQVKSKMQQMYERESGLDTQEKLEQARKKARSMMPFAPKEKTRTEKENANEIRRHQGRADQAKANRKKTPKANAVEALIGGTAAGAAAGANKLKKPRAGGAAAGVNKLKKMAVGGVAKAKKGRRGDGICRTGKTRGRMV